MTKVIVSADRDDRISHAACTSGADIRLPEAIAQLRAAATGTR